MIEKPMSEKTMSEKKDKSKAVERANILDRSISAMFPKWAVGRLKSRMQYSQLRYEAAKPTPDRPMTGRNEGDAASIQYQQDLYQIQREARNLQENFPVVAGLQEKFGTYGVGSNLRRIAHTGDDDKNKRIEEYLNECFASIDYTGRMDLSEMAQVVLRDYKLRGDIGFIPIINSDGSVQVQLIQPDCIGNPNRIITDSNLINGVHVDNFGKVTGYDVYRRNPNSSSYTFLSSYTPAEMGMVYRLTSSDHYRGVSAYASAINTIKDLKISLQGAASRIKYASTIAALVTKERGVQTPEDIGNKYFDSTEVRQSVDRNGNHIEEQSFALIKYLAEGEGVETLDAKFPEQMIQDFFIFMVHEIAVSVNLPFGFVWDMANLTGPGVRFDSAQVQRQIEVEQSTIRKRFLDPVCKRMILFGALSGRLNVDPQDPATYRGEWSFPAKISIDGRDDRIEIEKIRAGIKSKEEYQSERGKDWREVDRQIFIEKKSLKKQATEANVPYLDQTVLTAGGQFPTLARQAEQSPDDETPHVVEEMSTEKTDTIERRIDTPDTNEAEGSSGEIETPNAEEPAQDTALNGAQVTSLVDIVKAVATGELPRDSAIAIIQRAYLVPKDKASEILGSAGEK